MKQIQICYDRHGDFSKHLAEIKSTYLNRSCGDVTFYITWTGDVLDDLDAAIRQIEELFPESDYYGNEASGGIAGGELTYGVIVTCCIYDEKSSRTELLWVEQGTQLSSLDDLWNYCRTKEGLRAVELIPSISYLETLKIEGNVPNVDEDVLIFGGASVNYDNPTYVADIVAKGHSRTKEGMAVILYFGDKMNFFSCDILGWKGLGRLMQVTESAGKCINEIDSAPAYSIYEKYLSLSMDDKDPLVFPLIVEEDGAEFIRTPQTILPDRSMRMFVNIPKGTMVRIAYGDKNTILNNIFDKAKEIAAFQPEAIKAYSCAARRLFWGDSEVGKETRILETIAHVCGFYTGGEILRFGKKLRVLNQTLSIIAVRESSTGKQNVNVFKQNEELDKSLVSRLAYFTGIVSEEQENARRQLAEDKEELRESMEIINGLASEYLALYYVNLANNTLRVYSVDGNRIADTKQLLSDCSDPLALIQKFVNSPAVHPNDRALFSDFTPSGIKKRLAGSKKFTVRFRRNYGHGYLWSVADVVKYEAVDEEANIIVIGFAERDKEIKLEQDRRKLLDYFVQSYSSAYSVDLTNDTFEVIHMDHVFSQIFNGGGTRADMNSFITQHIHPEDQKMMFQMVDKEYVASRLRTEEFFNFTVREVFDGQMRTMRGLIVRGIDEYHVAIGFMDISDEIRAEEERQRQIQETLAAERANKAKSYFFSMVSHDIRTPLNAIIGYAELLKLGIEDEAERKQAIDSVLVSGHTLLELINDVLDLSKLEAGKMEIIPEPVDVMRLVDEVAKAFRATIGKKPVEIRTVLDKMPWLKLDPHRVRQILFNLVGNAVKFTENGFVEIRASYADGSFHFEVQDTGCGISEKDQERIAQPFVQVGSAANRGKGTGLGLAICLSLVSKMGGEMELTSALGVGTTFAVDIPCEEEDDIAKQERFSATQRIRIAVEHKTIKYKHILIVDDVPMNRLVLKTMLTRFGIQNVDMAAGGREALAKLTAANDYDLVLTDMWMPDMDGESLVAEIRRNPAWANLPVVAVTADVEAQKDYAFMGFTGILLKPITLEKLKGLQQ